MLQKTRAHWTRDRALKTGVSLEVALEKARSDDARVRKDAILCLTRIAPLSDYESISVLVASLEDDHDEVKLAALHSLEQLADRNDPVVISMVSQKTLHPEAKVRLAAVKVLGRIADRGNLKALEVLIAHARPKEEEIWQVRLVALQQLADIAPYHDWVVVGIFTACLNDCLNRICLGGAEEMGCTSLAALARLAPPDSPDVVDCVVACTRCENPYLQCVAFNALSKVALLGNEIALAAIISCLTRKVGIPWDVRKAALAAILQLAPPNHKKAVIAVQTCLAQSSDDAALKYETFRAIAFALSTWRHDTDGLQTLVASLEHSDWRLRKQALLVLIASVSGEQQKLILQFSPRLLHEDVAKALAVMVRRGPENLNVVGINGHGSVTSLLTKQDYDLKAAAAAALKKLTPDGVHEALFPAETLPDEPPMGPSLEIDGRLPASLFHKSSRQAFRRDQLPLHSRDQLLFGAPSAIFYPQRSMLT